MTLNIYLYCYWIERNIWFKGIQHYFSVKLMYYLYSILHCNSITNTVFYTVFSKIGHSAVNSTINCKIFRQRWKSAFHVPYFFSSKIFDETIRKCYNRFLWPSARWEASYDFKVLRKADAECETCSHHVSQIPLIKSF